MSVYLNAYIHIHVYIHAYIKYMHVCTYICCRVSPMHAIANFAKEVHVTQEIKQGLALQFHIFICDEAQLFVIQ